MSFVHNSEIATIFEQIADILRLQKGNFFRIRAYHQAALMLRGMTEDIGNYVASGRALTDLPHIGINLAAKITEILETGSCATLKRLLKHTPSGLTDLLHIPGLGENRVNTLYHELNIHTREQLLRASKDGEIQKLHGFGEKIQANIIHFIQTNQGQKQGMKLALAAQYAEPIVTYLQEVTGVHQVVIAGSYRRCKETVGDIDILVTASDPPKVLQAFGNYPQVRDILATGSTKATVILHCGLQVDLRVVPKNSYGSALVYFTGSRAHNVAIRQLAKHRALKINEYGVFNGQDNIASHSEQAVYGAIDLPWIAPELRENQGEIEAAQQHNLPSLISLSDLKGDLHAHTLASDGHCTLAEMAQAAAHFGLEYLAITEHSKRLTIAHGLDEKRLEMQIAEIDQLNEQLKGITLLKGIEVDILADGQLDLSAAILAKLDLVIGAVHSHFHLSRNQQTERILRAMDQPYFTILAHPTGRILQTRQPYDVDMQRILKQAKKRGCFVELNAQPDRLDLSAVHCQMAKAEGVLVSINSDAHQITDFANLKYAVGQARRGWLGKNDIFNTRSLSALRQLLA